MCPAFCVSFLVSLAGPLLLKCTKFLRLPVTLTMSSWSHNHLVHSLLFYPQRPSLNKTWSTWQYRFHVGWAIWHGERLFTKTLLPETVCKCRLTPRSPTIYHFTSTVLHAGVYSCTKCYILALAIKKKYIMYSLIVIIAIIMIMTVQMCVIPFMSLIITK